MKKKKTTALISTLAGICILSTAAFANYQSTNGYDVFKKALMSFYKYDNCTINANFAFGADGTNILEKNILKQYDSKSNTHYILDTEKSTEWESENYYENGKTYNRSVSKYSSMDEDVDFYYMYDDGYERIENVLGMDNEEYEARSTQKMIKFAELLGDTIVGDLKNNFICTEDGNNSKTYEISLTSIQIPEVINAGLSALFSIDNVRYEESLDETERAISNMNDNQVVDSVKIIYTVNADNMMTAADATLVFKGTDKDGQVHDITTSIKLDVTEIGTTQVKQLDKNSIRIRNVSETVTEKTIEISGDDNGDSYGD